MAVSPAVPTLIAAKHLRAWSPGGLLANIVGEGSMHRHQFSDCRDARRKCLQSWVGIVRVIGLSRNLLLH
jgi:hypothetical protein